MLIKIYKLSVPAMMSATELSYHKLYKYFQNLLHALQLYLTFNYLRFAHFAQYSKKVLKLDKVIVIFLFLANL